MCRLGKVLWVFSILISHTGYFLAELTWESFNLSKYCRYQWIMQGGKSAIQKTWPEKAFYILTVQSILNPSWRRNESSNHSSTCTKYTLQWFVHHHPRWLQQLQLWIHTQQPKIEIYLKSSNSQLYVTSDPHRCTRNIPGECAAAATRN